MATSDRFDVDVLIVDDSADFRTSLVSILSVTGYRVAEAEDGFVALERLRTLTPRPPQRS